MELALVFILIATIVACINQGRWRQLSPYFTAACLMLAAISFTTYIPLETGQVFEKTVFWSHQLGAHFNFYLDGLALIFCFMITIIGSGVFIYAASYMKNYPSLGRFYATLTIFTAAMLGLVLSDNMLTFFLFWETTSLTSFLLVGFKHEKQENRASARKALFITVGGGLFLLMAIALISIEGQQMGMSLADSLRFSKIDASLVLSDSYPWIVSFLAIAIATKSAQIPFHIWLPAAMAGPTPVSSFLHSATMVKAGIFLLARLTPMIGGSLLWVSIFTGMGAATMVIAALMSASQRDIKKILSYSTITVLGILVMLIGIGTDIAIKAAVVFLVAHALYKAALFQIIGNIDFATGSRDIKKLHNLGRLMPISAVAALLSALSMAGAPPLFGFFGKELAYLAKLQLGPIGFVLIILAVCANALMVGLAISICYRPFWTRKEVSDGPNVSRPVPLPMAIVPFCFSILGLFIGIFPGFFDEFVGSQTASSIGGKQLVMDLKLWHGINMEALLVLGLSVLTLGAGIVIAIKIQPIIASMTTGRKSIASYGPTHWYQLFFNWLPDWALKVTERFQNGDLNWYLKCTLGFIVVMVSLPFLGHGFWTDVSFPVTAYELILLLVIGLPTLICLVAKNRILKLIMLGISGFGLVIVFTLKGAPDLALTQLMIECLSLLFILKVILTHNPSDLSKKSSVSAMIIAAGFSLVILAVLLYPVPEIENLVANYFLENSLPEAFGRNVVNVILVDFRAMDTFGEIVAVCIAAIGIHSLLDKSDEASS